MGKDVNAEIYSGRFNEGYFSYAKPRIDAVLAVMQSGKGKMLDVGCGDGRITKVIASEKGLTPYGIELLKSNVKIAGAKGINAKTCDLEKGKIPFNDSYFDLVYCGEVLEHVVDSEGLLIELRRVLKKGKKIIVTVPNTAAWYNRILLPLGYVPMWVESGSRKSYGTPFGVSWGHVKAFTKKSAIELLEEYNFTIEEVKGSAVDPRGLHKNNAEKIGAAVLYRLDRLFALFPGLSSNIIIRARKN